MMLSILLAYGPVLTLPDINGKQIPLLSEPGKPCVAYVILKDCPIAKKFVPEIKTIAKKYNVRSVMIYVDPGLTAKEVRQHQKEYGLNFAAALDHRHMIPEVLKIKTVPTAVLFDVRGQAVYIGRIDNRFPELGQQKKPTRFDLRDQLTRDLDQPERPLIRTPVIGCFVPKL